MDGVDQKWNESNAQQQGKLTSQHKLGDPPADDHCSLTIHLYCMPTFFLLSNTAFFWGLLRRISVRFNYSGFDIILIHRYYYFRNAIIGFFLILF